MWKKILFVILLIILSWCGYFAWKIARVSRTMQVSSQDQTAANEGPSQGTLERMRSLATSLIATDKLPLKGAADGRTNILLLGRAGEHHSGRDLTDTIIVMSIDTNTDKIALLSLPRDLYVKVPDTSIFTKINAVYQHGLAQGNGIDLIEKTVADITDLPIHYSFIIDFDGFEKVIDALGDINVEVMRDIYDSRYPGPNYSYETFEIKKGWQTLNGATALKYVRERHDDPEGDFGRAKRQQQVIQAVKSKAFSLKTFVDAFALNDLLTILGDSIKTTIAPEEINSFIALSKQVDTNNISNVVVDAWKPDSLLRVSHVMVGQTRMFTLVPRVGNYSEIQDVAANLFDINAIKRRGEAIAAEEASITIINRSSSPSLTYRVKRLLQENLGSGQVRIATDNSTESAQNDSFIIDNTDREKPFSLDELLKKLPITLKESDGSMTQEDEPSSDFILILGDKLGKDLDFEEDSIDDFKNAEDDSIAYPKEMTP
ncbi:MAG: LCP family protein [Candidatus Moranbacteria bacterium]|nr:LCP family protein [Candidatus Moranbacteria bacterium]